MGWLYMHNIHTRREMIAHRTRAQEWESDGVKCSLTCLAHTFKGAPFAGVLYMVMESRRGERVDRFIEVDALKYTAELGGHWGYKDMEESMGPYYYGCPLRYLDMVPCPDSQHARDWRELVRSRWVDIRERAAQKRQRIAAARA